eukprot:329580_1
MVSTQNELIKLSNVPINSNAAIGISHILTLNETEFLIIIKYLGPSYKLKEIWIYNICNDNFTELIPEESVNETIKFYTASLNDNKSFLYLFGLSHKIIKLNLKTK